MELHLSAGSGVGPAPDIAAHDLVSLGDHVFNR